MKKASGEHHADAACPKLPWGRTRSDEPTRSTSIGDVIERGHMDSLTAELLMVCRLALAALLSPPDCRALRAKAVEALRLVIAKAEAA